MQVNFDLVLHIVMPIVSHKQLVELTSEEAFWLMAKKLMLHDEKQARPSALLNFCICN